MPTDAERASETWRVRYDVAHDEALVEHQRWLTDEMLADRVPGGGVHWPHTEPLRTARHGPQYEPAYKSHGVASFFHWVGGLYFGRLECGCVYIRSSLPIWEHGQQQWTIQNIAVIPAAEWASIICAVSRDGEDAERWKAAQDFHGRNEDAD